MTIRYNAAKENGSICMIAVHFLHHTARFKSLGQVAKVLSDQARQA